MAISTALGVGAALNGGKLDREWFDALARYESEIDELEFRTNADRAYAAIKAKRGL